MADSLRFLCVGDVVGKIGRVCFLKQLKSIKENYSVDSVLVNVENSAAGFGVTRSIYTEFQKQGVDAMTSGNHIYDRREIVSEIDQLKRLARPINFPQKQPGKGFVEYEVNGVKVIVLNAIGRVFMNHSDCPFTAIDRFLSKLPSENKIVLLDFHAETSSEKVAMGYAFDGRLSCMFGTHTHVQTADEKILPQGTAYITDLGMVGAYHSVIGMKKEAVIEKFYDQMPKRFEPVESGVVLFNAVIVDIAVESGKALHIERVSEVFV